MNGGESPIPCSGSWADLRLVRNSSKAGCLRGLSLMRTTISIFLVAALVLLACTGCPPGPSSTSSIPSANSAANTTDTSAVRPLDPLETRIVAAINLVRGRSLDQSHGFWTIFHGILGLGPDVKMID